MPWKYKKRRLTWREKIAKKIRKNASIYIASIICCFVLSLIIVNISTNAGTAVVRFLGGESSVTGGFDKRNIIEFNVGYSKQEKYREGGKERYGATRKGRAQFKIDVDSGEVKGFTNESEGNVYGDKGLRTCKGNINKDIDCYVIE